MMFSYLLRSLGFKGLAVVGRGLGRLLQMVGFRTTIVADNLDLALSKELSPDERKKLTRKIYDHVGTLFLEIVRNFSLTREGAKTELFIDEPELRILDQLKKNNEGALVLSAHIGNWELFPCGIAARDYKVSVVVKKISNPFYNAFVESRRKRAGFDVIYSGGTLPKVAAAIKDGHLVGFMIDQHMPGKRGIATTFFGAPASSIRGLAAFARDTQLKIIPMCIFRRDDGTHQLRILEPLPYLKATELPEGSQERAVKEEQLNCQQYQDAVEKLVRLNLSQWLWIHRRWKLARQLQSSRS